MAIRGRGDSRTARFVLGALGPLGTSRPEGRATWRAESVAARVPLEQGVYFTTARRQIRKALADNGVAREIDGLVEELLSARTSGSAQAP